MATSVVPALVDALVAQAIAALPTVLVHDGQAVTEDPGDYLMVGVDDPEQGRWADAASAEQEWAGLGAGARDITGSIWCVAESVNGDGLPKVARDAAAAIYAAVESLCRANKTLGVLMSGWVSVGKPEQWQQKQDDYGAHARVVFQVWFKGRI